MLNVHSHISAYSSGSTNEAKGALSNNSIEFLLSSIVKVSGHSSRYLAL